MAAVTRLVLQRGKVKNIVVRSISTEILPAVQEEADHKTFKSERDVPFLFLPHTVKKAYVINPAQTYLPKVFDKYKWLTKTLSTPGLPDTYEHKREKFEVLCKEFHDGLKHNVAFQKGYKNKNQLRYNEERVKYNIVSNFLKLTMVEHGNCNHLSVDESSLYHESLLITHWPRNYKFYQTRFRPTFCVRTRNGLSCVEDPQVLSEEEVHRIPGPYDNYALNSYRHHIVHLQNRPAMDNMRFNPIKHCHTTLMVNTRLRTDEHFYSLGVFTSFAQLIAQAQSSGVLHGTELESPLVTQTIVTNGYKMAFLVYQLNTMYLLDDKFKWNRCWYSPVFDMYKRSTDSRYHVFEDADRSELLDGFNETVCKYFLNFLAKETKM